MSKWEQLSSSKNVYHQTDGSSPWATLSKTPGVGQCFLNHEWWPTSEGLFELFCLNLPSESNYDPHQKTSSITFMATPHFYGTQCYSTGLPTLCGKLAFWMSVGCFSESNTSSENDYLLSLGYWNGTVSEGSSERGVSTIKWWASTPCCGRSTSSLRWPVWKAKTWKHNISEAFVLKLKLSHLPSFSWQVAQCRCRKSEIGLRPVQPVTRNGLGLVCDSFSRKTWLHRESHLFVFLVHADILVDLHSTFMFVAQLKEMVPDNKKEGWPLRQGRAC